MIWLRVFGYFFLYTYSFLFSVKYLIVGSYPKAFNKTMV